MGLPDSVAAGKKKKWKLRPTGPSIVSKLGRMASTAPPGVRGDLFGRNRSMFRPRSIPERDLRTQIGLVQPRQGARARLAVGDEHERVFGERRFGALQKRGRHRLVPAERQPPPVGRQPPHEIGHAGRVELLPRLPVQRLEGLRRRALLRPPPPARGPGRL